MPTEKQTAPRRDVPMAIHAPPAVRDAVRRAADRELLSMSSYLRRIIRDRLRDDGLLAE